MTDTSPPDDPIAYQEWLDALEQKWQAGLIPDPQAVSIILVNPRGEVLLQLRDNNPNISFANSWTLPGGVVELHEAPEKAAQRELAEETGIHSKLSHWKTYKRKHQKRKFTIEQHVYTGTTHQEASEMTLGEGQALNFFKREKLPTLSIGFDFDKLLDEFFEQKKEIGSKRGNSKQS
jgi:8-oxo-dGTP diphosphatase